jgi:hypothetical protein
VVREARDEHGNIRAVWVSAAQRLGLERVRAALDERAAHPGSNPAGALAASRAA